MNFMDITFAVNLWFLVALCVMCMLIGGWLFNGRSSGRDRFRY
jgi:hypothetical protein